MVETLIGDDIFRRIIESQRAWGERVGFYAIHGNDDGNGSIPFDQIIDALSLDFTVAWSDGTTDGDSE